MANTMKAILINENGCSLRNLPSAKFNDQSARNIGKQVTVWTFSVRGANLEEGKLTATMQKALDHLASKGIDISKLKFVPYNDEQESKTLEASAKAAVKSGKTQPRTNAEAIEVIKELDPEILTDDSLYQGVHERCSACKKHCKLSKKCVLWSCPQFELIDKNAA